MVVGPVPGFVKTRDARGGGTPGRVAAARSLCYADKMKITCPDCGFFRELVADRVPARPVIATCPKCGCRFRFQPEDASCRLIEHGRPAPAGPAASPAHEDDPLPPGAIVPGRTVAGQTAPQEPADDSRTTITTAKDSPEGGTHAEQESAGHADEETPRPTNRKGRQRPAPDDDLNPWDMAPHPAGYLSAFYQTTLRVMFGAGRFFAHLAPDAPQFRALGYALIISLITVCSQYLWLSMTREMLEQAAPADAALMIVIRFALDNPLLYVLISLASFAFQIYFVSVLLFLGFRITGVKHASFYILFQVVAYSCAPLLLCIVPVLGPHVGLIWSLACLVNGCRVALDIDWPRTLLGIAPMVLLFVVLFSSMRLPH